MNPVEFLYYLGYLLKKRRSFLMQRRLPHKVISIGNITVGGAGKTPATIAVAEEARKKGYRPVILTRGYRGSLKGPCLVNDGTRILSVAEAGDEPIVMARRLKDVPVVKSGDRYEGGVFAISHIDKSGPPPLFILDDGFQHWRLARDVDVVLVDGLNPFGNRRLLPAGPLRGPVSELKNADMLIVTKTQNHALANELGALNRRAHVYYASHEVTGLRAQEGSAMDPGLIKDRRVLAFCGIASPDSLRNTLTTLGCYFVGFRPYRDHYRYAQKDIAGIEAAAAKLGAEFIVTTEKDMVKLIELPRLPSNLLSVEIGFRVEPGFYEELFRKLEVV